MSDRNERASKLANQFPRSTDATLHYCNMLEGMANQRGVQMADIAADERQFIQRMVESEFETPSIPRSCDSENAR